MIAGCVLLVLSAAPEVAEEASRDTGRFSISAGPTAEVIGSFASGTRWGANLTLAKPLFYAGGRGPLGILSFFRLFGEAVATASYTPRSPHAVVTLAAVFGFEAAWSRPVPLFCKRLKPANRL